MNKIVVLDGYGMNPGDMSWEPLEQLGDVTIYDRTAPSEILDRVGDADMVLTNKVVLSADTIARFPNVKYIGVLATGTNVVDLDAASGRGIVVTNIPSYSTESVAQLVFAHLLNILTRVDHYACCNRESRWNNSPDFVYWDFPMHELAGKTMGIVGFGHIGRRVTKIALAFGMKVKAFTSKPQDLLPEGVEKSDLDTLFAESDVVSLHCPLAPDTYHLVNEKRLKLMKPTAILVNTARGPIVKEHDLAEALRNGTIYAAGLDVLSVEPPTAENPLLTAPNCFITPHIGWATIEARRRLLAITVDNIRAFRHGTPINRVN